MKKNELIAVVLIILIVTIGACFIVNAVYQPKQSTNIPNPSVTIAPTMVISDIIPTATQIQNMTSTSSSILTVTHPRYVYSTKTGYDYYPEDYVCNDPAERYVNNSEGQIVGIWCNSGNIHRVFPTEIPTQTTGNATTLVNGKEVPYLYSTARGLKPQPAGFVCTEKPTFIYDREGVVGVWCEH